MFKLLSGMFNFFWRVCLFIFFYILIGPITLVFYVAKWIFKGFK